MVRFAAAMVIMAALWQATRGEAAGVWFDRIYVIIFENADYSTAIANPNFAKWAAAGKTLTNYNAVAHPSEPNYVAMVAGATLGVIDDGNYNLPEKNLVDLLEPAGITWTSYNENYVASPNTCNLAATIGSQVCPNSGNTHTTSLYARKHNPFVSFSDIQSSPNRCNFIVSSNQLAVDSANNAIPQVVWYVPNQCNDGHDTDVTYAGEWLDGFMTGTLQGNAVTERTMVVITFDENDGTAGNRIFTALVPFGSMSITVGSSDDTSFNHYSLLKTIEQNFGLGNLGQKDVSAAPFNFP